MNAYAAQSLFPNVFAFVVTILPGLLGNLLVLWFIRYRLLKVTAFSIFAKTFLAVTFYLALLTGFFPLFTTFYSSVGFEKNRIVLYNFFGIPISSIRNSDLSATGITNYTLNRQSQLIVSRVFIVTKRGDVYLSVDAGSMKHKSIFVDKIGNRIGKSSNNLRTYDLNIKLVFAWSDKVINSILYFRLLNAALFGICFAFLEPRLKSKRMIISHDHKNNRQDH
jgi:hypothetical protein